MKSKIVFLALVASISCATLPPEQRSVQAVSETKATKKQAFSRVLLYLAKNQNNSLFAIQLKDEDAGRIVSNASVNCDSLSGIRYGIATHKIDFHIDVTVKDYKARVILDGVTHSSSSMGSSHDLGPSSEEQMADIHAQCLKPIESGIFAAIDNAGRSDDF